jgi:hypothetical protein
MRNVPPAVPPCFVQIFLELGFDLIHKTGPFHWERGRLARRRLILNQS